MINKIQIENCQYLSQFIDKLPSHCLINKGITGCGGTTATYTSNVITGYKATKSKLEITTTYAFFNGETNTIYKDYNKTISLDTYTGGSTEETTTYLDNYVKNNKDKLNTLVYTFESTNGRNYYFTGLKNNR